MTNLRDDPAFIQELSELELRVDDLEAKMPKGKVDLFDKNLWRNLAEELEILEPKPDESERDLGWHGWFIPAYLNQVVYRSFWNYMRKIDALQEEDRDTFYNALPSVFWTGLMGNKFDVDSRKIAMQKLDDKGASEEMAQYKSMLSHLSAKIDDALLDGRVIREELDSEIVEFIEKHSRGCNKPGYEQYLKDAEEVGKEFKQICITQNPIISASSLYSHKAHTFQKILGSLGSPDSMRRKIKFALE